MGGARKKTRDKATADLLYRGYKKRLMKEDYKRIAGTVTDDMKKEGSEVVKGYLQEKGEDVGEKKQTSIDDLLNSDFYRNAKGKETRKDER